MRRLSVVVVAPWVYHPKCGIGGGVQCYDLLAAVADKIDLHWLSFDVSPNGLDQGKADLARICVSVNVVPLPYTRHALARWRELASRIPIGASYNRSDNFGLALRRVLEHKRCDVAWIQFPQMAQYIDYARATPTVMDIQDIATVSSFRAWKSSTNLWDRLKWSLACRAWQDFEYRWYSRADLLLAFSDSDLGVLRAFLPRVQSVKIGPSVTTQAVVDVARSPRAVLLLGNFSHEPNLDGFRWLRDAVWPGVLRRVGDARLLVAGVDLSDQELNAKDRSVKYLGFVPDLNELYGLVRVAVVPYRFGGGVKIKALDAMARGCPVVATSIGAEGIGAVDGVTMRIADSPAGFAEAICELLEQPTVAADLGMHGRSAISAAGTVEERAAELAEALDRMLERRAEFGRG